MQHADAIQAMATEKYLLGELTPELREEFEEHLFSCPDCASDMRAASAFVEISKVALSEKLPATRPVAVSTRPAPGWFAWLRPAIAVPVMALLLLVIGYQNFVAGPGTRREVADLRTPQILPSALLVSARSDRVPLLSVRPNQSFLLFVDVPADHRFQSYLCELYSPSGSLVWSLPVSAEAAKDTLPLQVPAGVEVSGRYTLAVSGVVSGQDRTPLVRYPFDLQNQR